MALFLEDAKVEKLEIEEHPEWIENMIKFLENNELLQEVQKAKRTKKLAHNYL